MKCEHCGHDPEKIQGINITIFNEDIPAYGAYLSSSASEGNAQIILNCALHYKTAKAMNDDFISILSETAEHEIIHALQELLGRSFSESDICKIQQDSEGIEMCSDDLSLMDDMAEGIKVGQELFSDLKEMINAYQSCGYHENDEYQKTVAIIRKIENKED